MKWLVVMRGTMDIDIILKWTMENLEKTEESLNKLGLICRLPIMASDVYNFRQEYINNRNLIAWNFYNPILPSEQVDIIITHDLSQHQTINSIYQDTNIKVISKNNLIQMKKDSVRPQDLLDIETLQKLS